MRLGPTELSSFDDATTPAGQQLAVEPSGDGFGIWSEIRGTARTIKVARLQADVGFLPSHTLTTDVAAESTQSSPAQLAVDTQGNAVAMWDVLERGLFFPSASVFK